MSEYSDFRLIGDPHITKKFEIGVPLARRGERERSLFDDFKKRLYDGDERIIIMVGDLLERPICTLFDAYRIYSIVLDAAQTQPDREFFYMAGNHDISPQKDNFGAFDILKLFNGRYPNLHIITKPTVYDRIAMFPWEWDRTALEQLEDVEAGSFEVAVGHWDLVSYDDMHMDHYCPAVQLVELGAKQLFSGHWHVAGEYRIDGIVVQCTGSMQPMTHAEDPQSKLYVTLTLEEYQEADPIALKDKYVRVIAEKDDEVEPLLDCLGFKVNRKASDNWESDYAEVEIENFNTRQVVEKNLKKHEVPEFASDFIKERIDATD